MTASSVFWLLQQQIFCLSGKSSLMAAVNHNHPTRPSSACLTAESDLPQQKKLLLEQCDIRLLWCHAILYDKHQRLVMPLHRASTSPFNNVWPYKHRQTCSLKLQGNWLRSVGVKKGVAMAICKPLICEPPTMMLSATP